MSWQAFVDTNLVGSGNFSEALILGHNKQIWAKSEERLSIPDKELDVILKAFADPSNIFTTGFTVRDNRYVTMKADDRSLYGRASDNDGGILCVKTLQTLIIGFYNKDMQQALSAVTVESLADQLIEANF